MKKKVMWFFDMFIRALNPFSYKDLSEIVLRIPVKFFFILILISTALLTILSIPTFITLSDDLAVELSKFDKFDISVNASTSEPIVFPEEKPFMVIDLSEDANITQGRLRITKDLLTRKTLFGEKVVEWEDYEDVTDDMETVKSMLMTLLILMIPLIYLIIFHTYALVFICIILLFTIISTIVLSFTRFRVSFEQLLKISIFASTPMIFVILTEPYSILNFSDLRYVIFIVVFLIYGIIGIIKTGSFDLHKKTKRFK